MPHPARVAVIGAGPAGIYAAHHLIRSDATITVDVLDRLPTPYGLIRYGVAPDHPRIKDIVDILHDILADPRIRFLGNIDYGVDVTPADLDPFYDATIVATGADRDRDLPIPGITLPGSFGAADFVSWYDGHPDVPREWPLTASRVAVIGAGNVALDVARILAKSAGELLTTEIPDNVHRGLLASPVTDVHLFSRRGPAQVKFTPNELRELDESPHAGVIVDPQGLRYDQASHETVRKRATIRTCTKILHEWSERAPLDRPRRLHLHFLQAPAAVLGTDRVTGLRTETQELTGDGTVRGTGVFTDWDVQAVYRAVGYRSSPVAGLPLDPVTHTVPHDAGRVIGPDGTPITGRYVTGWIKRGPAGLIGHTKKDANETVTSLLADLPELPAAPRRAPSDVLDHLAAKGLTPTTWAGWQRVDRHEIDLGRPTGRQRVKVVPRADLIAISGTAAP